MDIWGLFLGIICLLVARGSGEADSGQQFMEACAKQELFASVPPLNFTCSDKIAGGYYADMESGCHIFHLCAPSNVVLLTDHQFCCHPELVFDQRFLVCDRPENVDCWASELYYNDQFPAAVIEAEKRSKTQSEGYSEEPRGHVQADSQRQSRGNSDSREDKTVFEGHTDQTDGPVGTTHAPGKAITLPPQFRHS